MGDSDGGMCADTRYAMSNDGVYFGPPIDSVFKADEIRGASAGSVREYGSGHTQYMVELQLRTLDKPRKEIWFLHEHEYRDFCARINIVLRAKK